LASHVPDVELVAAESTISRATIGRTKYRLAPLEVNGFDDEAERRTDSVDIFIHDFFDYGCFASIVQSPFGWVSIVEINWPENARTASRCASPCPSSEPCGVWKAFCLEQNPCSPF